MVECALRDAVVVGVDVVGERGLELCGRFEAGLGNDLGDAAVEAFDHAVGLWVARGREAMLDLKAFAAFVEGMPARGGSGLAGEAVGELAAVIGQDLADFHRRRLVQTPEEIAAAGLALIGVDVDEHPPRGSVDCNEEVAPAALVGHLGQVLDVDVDEPGLVVLEGLGRGHDALGNDQQLAQPGHAVATQAAIEPRARHGRIDELARHDQQVIERQQQRAPQLDHHRLLSRRQRGAELVRAMRAVLRVLPVLPLARRRPAHVVELRKLFQRAAGRLDFRPRPGRRAGLGMYLAHTGCSAFIAAIAPRITSLARIRGQLRVGI